MEVPGSNPGERRYSRGFGKNPLLLLEFLLQCRGFVCPNFIYSRQIVELKSPHLSVLRGGKPAKYSRFEKVENDPSSTIAAEDLKFFLESWYDECHNRYLSNRTLELRATA